MSLIPRELRTQWNTVLWTKLSGLMCMAYNSLTENTIHPWLQVGPQVSPLWIFALVVWMVFTSCKKWSEINALQKREDWHCDCPACSLTPAIVKSDQDEKMFSVHSPPEIQSWCSSGLSVTMLPWGELRTAFKFKRTAAFCSLRPSEVWPKTVKGFLAETLCQRFNIWILPWDYKVGPLIKG